MQIAEERLLLANFVLDAPGVLGQLGGPGDGRNVPLQLRPFEQNVTVLEEAVQHPVADPHRGAQHDGDVLQRHLVEPLALDDVAHVHEDVGEQEPVAFGQLLQQAFHALDPLLGVRIRRDLFELGHQFVR